MFYRLLAQADAMSYDLMRKNKTPRLVFLGAKPNTRDAALRLQLLKVVEGHLDIFAPVVELLAIGEGGGGGGDEEVATAVMETFGNNPGIATLFTEYQRVQQAAKEGTDLRYQVPCIPQGDMARLFELRMEWSEAYGQLDHQQQEAFVRGLIYTYFKVHPDALPRLVIMKYPLSDAINALLDRYCLLTMGGKPVATA
jgi:hypothetical protein